MKQVFKKREDGTFDFTDSIVVDGEIPEGYEEINTNETNFEESTIKYKDDGTLFVKSLDEIKAEKLAELKRDCDEAILGRFTSLVNGVEYSFSNDAEAQANFSKVKDAFKDGYIESMNWTAYDTAGNIVRLPLDWVTFEPIYKDHLNHIQANVAKLRDVLQPQVEAADETTLGDIVW